MREKTSNFVFPEWSKTGETKILIVEESRKPGRPLGEPGGKREQSDASDAEAARREFTEETGYRAIVEEEPFIEVRDGNKIRKGFGAIIVGGERRPTPNHQYVGWVALHDLESLFEAGRLRGEWVLNFASAYMKRQSDLFAPADVEVDLVVQEAVLAGVN